MRYKNYYLNQLKVDDLLCCLLYQGVCSVFRRVPRTVVSAVPCKLQATVNLPHLIHYEALLLLPTIDNGRNDIVILMPLVCGPAEALNVHNVEQSNNLANLTPREEHRCR